MLNDVMAGFELYQPTDLGAAVDLLSEHGAEAWILAGGYDSLDWFKDRTRTPSVVIDLERVEELRGIRESPDGVEIGALTTLADVVENEPIRQSFPILAQAASTVASPQIRNAATIGGNICQDTRCWYYRYGVTCYRAGGNTCYAAGPQSMNREHAIFGAHRCVAVSPSDTAPALVALDAEMAIVSAQGERTVKAEDFFVEPSQDIRRMTVLDQGEILAAIRLPNTWADAASYFEKASDRKSWDFALASVAAVFEMSGDQVQAARIVCGSVQCVPRRMTSAEAVVRGRARTETVAREAGQRAVRDAQPLARNGYKVPLTESLVARAIRG